MKISLAVFNLLTRGRTECIKLVSGCLHISLRNLALTFKKTRSTLVTKMSQQMISVHSATRMIAKNTFISTYERNVQDVER
jgi:hypothetical protein